MVIFSWGLKNPIHETIDETRSENIPMLSSPCTPEVQVSDVYVTQI